MLGLIGLLILTLVLGGLAVGVDRLNFPQRPFRPRPADTLYGRHPSRDRTGAHVTLIDDEIATRAADNARLYVGGPRPYCRGPPSSVTTPAVPEAAQAIYLGRIWPAGKQSDSWSGTLSFTISNPSNVIRESVEVDAFLMFEAAPAVTMDFPSGVHPCT